MCSCYSQVWGGQVRHILSAGVGEDDDEGGEGGPPVPDGGDVHAASSSLPPLAAHQHPRALPQRLLPGGRKPSYWFQLLILCGYADEMCLNRMLSSWILFHCFSSTTPTRCAEIVLFVAISWIPFFLFTSSTTPTRCVELSYWLQLFLCVDVLK